MFPMESQSSEQLEGRQVTHHDDLWFQDGNIVLVAGDVAFQVHRSMLARHSRVFKDMFELSQPSAEEVHDGRPVVTLHDSPHELADLLDVIYNGSRFFGRDKGKPGYPLIQSLLRLGTKYEIETVRSEALRYLESILPPHIHQWDLVEKDPPITYDDGDIVSMVNLTSELDLETMYPRALYRCCQLPTRSILQGTEHPRGRQQLSTDHAVVCLDGRTRLTSWKQSMMEDITWFWDQGLCDSDDRECVALKKALAKRRHSTMWTLDADPLQLLETWLRDINPGEASGSRLCSLCTERQSKFIQYRRIRIFGRLRECFNPRPAVQDPPSPKHE